jgi:DNA polymerase III sliding clamp (beta) subunit (PCNA family)
LKKVKKSTSTDEKKKKKDGISFEVSGNLDIKKLLIDKPKLSGEINVPILVLTKTKSRFYPRMIR